MDGPLKRGSVVTVAAPGDYAKPRPALVVQSDFFHEHPSITLCLITSDLRNTPLCRLPVHPNPQNGLERSSQIMVDKIMTVSREKVRDVVGRWDDKSLVEVNRALAQWVGIAGTLRTRVTKIVSESTDLLAHALYRDELREPSTGGLAVGCPDPIGPVEQFPAQPTNQNGENPKPPGPFLGHQIAIERIVDAFGAPSVIIVFLIVARYAGIREGFSRYLGRRLE